MDCVKCNFEMVKNGKTIVGSQKYLCKQCGYRCTPNKKGYSAEFKLEVLSKLHSGMPTSKVAKEFGVDSKTVVSWSKDRDVLKLFKL